MILSRRFSFEATHTLKREIEAEGSARLHGHSYRVEIGVSGVVDEHGMILDGALIVEAFSPIREALDHRNLDDVQGLGQATLENLCAFIWRGIEPTLEGVCRVVVWRETVGDSCCLEKTQ